MFAIKHLVYVDAPRADIYKAVTTKKGISSWWTTETSIEPIAGKVAEFIFGDRYHNKMYIAKLIKYEYVEWECLDGDREWIGTKIKFELMSKGKGTNVRFSHFDWQSNSDFFASCCYQWALYLSSLKSYCETGKGMPFQDR